MRRVRIQSDGTDATTVVTLEGKLLEGVRSYTIDHPLGEEATATVELYLPIVDVSAEGRMVGRFGCCGHVVVCPNCGGDDE
jgi:hypothetical protein